MLYSILDSLLIFSLIMITQHAADKAPEKLRPYTHFAAAAAAFIACSVVLVPGELVKQNLQVVGILIHTSDVVISCLHVLRLRKLKTPIFSITTLMTSDELHPLRDNSIEFSLFHKIQQNFMLILTTRTS